MPSNLFKRTIGRLLKRLRPPGRGVESEPLGDPTVLRDSPLASRAASVIEGHATDHSALFERASRLIDKAERLEREGTPSESASNRAERARTEVEASLAALRSSFVAETGADGEEAFDRELRRRIGAVGNPDTSP